jgi:ankyrin repeat protein
MGAHASVVSWLVRQVPSLASDTGWGGLTPLHRAATTGCVRTCRALLNVCPLSLVSRDDREWTPKQWAQAFDLSEMASWLDKQLTDSEDSDHLEHVERPRHEGGEGEDSTGVCGHEEVRLTSTRFRPECV